MLGVAWFCSAKMCVEALKESSAMIVSGRAVNLFIVFNTSFKGLVKIWSKFSL